MPRIAYVNGAYRPIAEAGVNIEDRGYQFGDGVYEVCAVVDGVFLDLEGHLDRLEQSLGALAIPHPVGRTALRIIFQRVLRVNRLSSAILYLQVTRGPAQRNHLLPTVPLPPTLVVTARPFNFVAADREARKGITLLTQEDRRWGRVDIKTIMLLPNVIAKSAARDAGAGEAMLVRDGIVTEGASTNIWLVNDEGVLVTHPADTHILNGITRRRVIECAQSLQLTVEERPFTVEEVKAAKEIFITSATAFVTPVTHIDGEPVSDGKPGRVGIRLRDTYLASITP